MARRKVISIWLAAFGAPGITAVDKDSRPNGAVFQDFRTARNIALQAVIPGHRQIAGGPMSIDADISE